MRPLSLATSLTLALAPLTLVAQVPPDAGLQVDRIFAEWSTATSPGCAVGVTKDGLTVLERAYGMADLEHDVPNTPETIFEGGSLSKQFTAAAIALLVLDGRISLDDDVREYVPELPDYGVPIPLHRLLTHTSGLRDWGSVAGISGWGREERSHDHDDVLDILSRQSALNFDPGHEYSYSNSGYNLLAIIVSRVSGSSFAEFSEKRIFEPLGMTRTQWRDDYRRIVPGRSTAYSDLDGGGWEINRPIEHVHGNGGILTTVGDLAIWNQALTDGRLGGQGFLEIMHRKGHLSDGSEIVYASGLRVEELAGVPAVTHTGSTAGYRAFLARYPEQGLSVAMLCNASNVSTGGTGARIARVYLGDAAKDAVPPASVSVPEARLRSLVGLYREPVTGETRELRLEGGRLHDGGTELIPLSERELVAGASDRRYVFSASGRAGGFEIESWEYSDQRWEPVERWTPSPADLTGFAGTYHSDDAETTFVVRVVNGSLVLWRRPADTWTLEPIYRDGFTAGGLTVRFRREQDGGPVTGLSLSLGRVYDMRFARISGETGTAP